MATSHTSGYISLYFEERNFLRPSLDVPKLGPYNQVSLINLGSRGYNARLQIQRSLV